VGERETGKGKTERFFSCHLPFTPKKERVIATFTAEGNAAAYRKQHGFEAFTRSQDYVGYDPAKTQMCGAGERQKIARKKTSVDMWTNLFV